MLFRDLIENMEIIETFGDLDVEIESIAYDSRKTKQGVLFVCITGNKMDGHLFIPDAIENGSKTFIIEREVDIIEKGTYVRVADARLALAQISNALYDFPSKKLNLIGVTGTKGKTTTTYMIKSILEAAEQKVGLIGTLKNMIGEEVIHTARTTPEAPDLQALFSEMLDKKVNTAIMEVSSQGLALNRVYGCEYDIGVFTNLSRDHIGPGEHESMEEYFEAKQKLFNMCKKGLVNIDSEYGKKIIETAQCKMYTFGIDSDADIRAVEIQKRTGAIEFKVITPWGSEKIKVNIQGVFNAYNALAAIGACCLKGISFENIKKGLERVSVPGRLEVVDIEKDYTVIIDYAHTPDSLEKLLTTVREHAQGRVVCLFGCGGDRDRGKRPLMGEIAGKMADFVIITSDNPRTEEPNEIVDEIEKGITNISTEYVKIVDRREAIKYALDNAKVNDIIVLAGKGHETYQQFKDKTIHFDEREVVRDIIEN